MGKEIILGQQPLCQKKYLQRLDSSLWSKGVLDLRLKRTKPARKRDILLLL
jgi:hypothetical protein